MEIAIGLVVITLGIYSVSWIHELRSTVNKQQEQIDGLYQQNTRLFRMTTDLNQVSMDIANKAISIEERVDKYTKIVE